MPPIKTSYRFVSAEKGAIRTCNPTKYLNIKLTYPDLDSALLCNL